MPTYEYKCRGCGKMFSVVQGIKEAKLTVHEGCGGELERLISGGRLMLTERKGGRPDDAEFAGSPGDWEDDAFGDGMGGMDAMGGMAGMGGIPGMGGGYGDFGGPDAEGDFPDDSDYAPDEAGDDEFDDDL